MTISELKPFLEAHKIPTTWYHLGSFGAIDQTTVLEQEDDHWTVYYAERGGRFDEQWFTDEHDACNELIDRMQQRLIYLKSQAKNSG